MLFIINFTHKIGRNTNAKGQILLEAFSTLDVDIAVPRRQIKREHKADLPIIETSSDEEMVS